MSNPVQKTMSVGDLIAAVFDSAALQGADPKQVARLATITVAHLLRRAHRAAGGTPLAIAG